MLTENFSFTEMKNKILHALTWDSIKWNKSHGNATRQYRTIYCDRELFDYNHNEWERILSSMTVTPGRQHICLMYFVYQPLICTSHMEENIHIYWWKIIMGASNSFVLIIKDTLIIHILTNMDDVCILHAS